MIDELLCNYYFIYKTEAFCDTECFQENKIFYSGKNFLEF
jgi:hypothetical protein